MSDRQAIPLAQGGVGYRCAWCERVQPVDQFGQDKARPEGITLHCLTCARRRSAESRQYDRMGILPVKGRHRDFGRKVLCAQCHTLKHRYSFDRGTHKRASVCWMCEEAKHSIDDTASVAAPEPAAFDPQKLIADMMGRGISLLLQNDKLGFRGGQLTDDEYAAMHLHPVRVKQVVRKRVEAMLGEEVTEGRCISIPAAPPVGALVSHMHFGLGRVVASTLEEVVVEFCDKRGSRVRKRIGQAVAWMPLVAEPPSRERIMVWLDDLDARNIHVSLDGSDICVDAPRDTLRPLDTALFVFHKAEIIRVLQESEDKEQPTGGAGAQPRDDRYLRIFPPTKDINADLFGFGSDFTSGEWGVALNEPAEWAGEFGSGMLSHVSDWGLVVSYRDPYRESLYRSFLVPWAKVAYIHRAIDRDQDRVPERVQP